ncbi:MAG: hypothetical protein M3N08_09030 [Pseudomonadota bacterium]|nr:hypothetical protein [Pseudomonadota bacterium]
MKPLMTRRTLLAAAAAAVPVLATSKVARALTQISAVDAKYPQISGVWEILQHATDGSNPSTAIESPPPAQFTPGIRALEGKEIELEGYLTPVAGGFGKKPEYILSRGSFHCPYCYPLGRASLAMAVFEGHVPQTQARVRVKGELALQDKDPGDFYFQVRNARII